MELDILKGTRDYLPEVQILREEVARVCKETFELFGFSPAETPILNYHDVLASKYAGGAEILKETYRLSDQGGRDLGLRYDLTVPFARVVGMNQGGQLPTVFKRYEIGKVFRNGPTGTGRLREFTQCDIDVVSPAGADTSAIDAEFVAIAARVFGGLGIPVVCCVNNRKFLSALLSECGVPRDRVSDAILAVDKWAKIGPDGVSAEFKEKGLDPAIVRSFAARTTGEAAASSGVPDAIRKVLRGAAALGVPGGFLKWEPGLARGLEIYTGTVFEFFWRADDGSARPNEKLSSSIAAGGRYDKIIGQFLFPDDPTKHESFPAAGMSFGLDRITEVLRLVRGETGYRSTVTEALLFAFDEASLGFALQSAAALRDKGVRCEVDYAHKKIKNSVAFAERMKIPFHIAVGSQEVEKKIVALKDMAAKTTTPLPPAEAADRILAGRKK
jgi:histidyl-tRNA synthetase